MIIGLSITAFTTIHVIIAFVALASGVVVLVGMLGAHRMPGWTALFLITTILTSVTGFMFPMTNGFTPALGIGIASMVVLVIALLALYGKHLAGGWRTTYVVTAVAALYVNFVALVAQSFAKVAVLHPLAPTQSEPPFLIAQSLLLVIFAIVGTLATRRFRSTTS